MAPFGAFGEIFFHVDCGKPNRDDVGEELPDDAAA
jgi:hypothetical protein